MYGHDFHPENLQKLIMSETSIFDVLHDFFYHPNKAVRMAALEVYVRRAYISYELTCLQHQELYGSMCIVQFQFLLPTSHPNRCVMELLIALLVKWSKSYQILRYFCRIPHNKACHMMNHVPSIEEMQYTDMQLANLEDCQRTGIMAAFTKFEEFVTYFDELMDQYVLDSPPNSPRARHSESEDTKLSSSVSSNYGESNMNDNESVV